MGEDAEALRKRLDTILQSVGDGVLGIDAQGVISSANPAAARLLGYSATELVGQPSGKLYPPGRDDVDDDSPIAATLRDGTVHHVRGGEKFVRKDGKAIDIEYVSAPVSSGGKRTGAVVVFRTKGAETALRESEERFRRLADATTEGVVIHDRGVVLDANERFAEMMGYPLKDLLNKSLVDLTAPEARETTETRVRAGVDGSYETTLLRKDGAKVKVEINARGFPYQGRTVRVATVRDVSQAPKAEEEPRVPSVSRPLVRKIVHDLIEAGGVAHQILQTVGRKLAAETPAKDIDGYTESFAEMGLGELITEKREEGRFSFVGSDLLENQPGSRVATCYFTLGFLSEAVSRISNGEPTLGTEIECQSRGSHKCRFIVQVKKPEEGLARRVKELV